MAEFKSDELKAGADGSTALTTGGSTALTTGLDAHIRREGYERQVTDYVQAVARLLGDRVPQRRRSGAGRAVLMVAVVGHVTHGKIGHLSNRKIVQVADALERTLGVYWIAERDSHFSASA